MNGPVRSRPVVIQVVNSLERAGAERMAVDLARRLDRAEWDVHVVVVRDGPLREYVEGGGIRLYQTGHGFDRTALIALAKMAIYFRTMRPEIVHTHLLGSDIVGRIAALLAGVPIVVSTQHDMLPRPWYWTLYKRLTNRTAVTVACSSQVAAYCRDVMHVPIARLHEIDNGADVDAFATAAHPRREPVTFGAVGSLTPVKGHRVLLEAFAHVAEEIPGSRLLIAGHGVEQPALEELIDRLGLQDRVQLRGVVHDVAGFLGEIDVFVHPSLSEGLPMALLEAMAAARPCITTDVSVLPEVVGCPEAGACVPPGDADALAAEMVRIGRDAALAASLGERAQRRVRDRYSLQRSADAYSALYRDLIREVEYTRDSVPLPREPTWWRAGAHALRFGLLGTLLYFIGRALASGVSQVRFDTLRVDVPQLLLSMGLLGVYYLLFAGGLTLLFRATGHRASYSDVFKVSFTSNLGKYVPGGVWPIAARAALAPRLGMGRLAAVMLSVAESAVSVAGGALAVAVPGLLGIVTPGAPASATWIGLGIAAGTALLLPWLLSGRFLTLLHGVLRVPDRPLRLGYPSTLGLIAYYAGTWLVAGAAFRTLASAVVGDPGAGVAAYAAYYAFASIVGLLVLFAPSGIGAREGALMLALTGPLGAPAAAMIALLARLWSTVTELVVSAVALLLPYRPMAESADGTAEEDRS